MKKLLLFTITVCLLLTSCNLFTKKKNKSDIINTSVVFDWYTSMTFTGEVVASKSFAKENNLNIELMPGSETTDPIKLVLAGQSDFGCISSEKLLLANEKGANLVAIGVINQLSPTVFLSKKDKNIKNPSDWKGKIVGVLPGGATEYVYRSLLKKSNLTNKDLKEVTIPFDLATFIANKYDIRPAFVYDEPVFLESQKIDYNIIEPKNYDVNYVGRVYFTKRETIKSNPDKVQAFINAVSKGWDYSFSNKDSALAILKSFEPKTDIIRDLSSLNKAESYYKDKNGHYLTFNYKFWDETVAELLSLGIIKNSDYRSSVNDTFINKYYTK